MNLSNLVSLCRQPKRTENYIILDWDDTLHPTTYLDNCHVTKDIFDSDDTSWLQIKNEKDQADLQVFDTCLKEFMEIIFDLTPHVFIVTNSIIPWLEKTGQCRLPKSYPYIIKAVIISARENYGLFMPNEPMLWKKWTFYDLFPVEDSVIKKNIICIGDSLDEKVAITDVARDIRNCILKTFKMKDRPTLIELIEQIKLLSDKVPSVMDWGKGAHLMLVKNDCVEYITDEQLQEESEKEWPQIEQELLKIRCVEDLAITT